ncbi:MAG: methyltransferase domain-containing protein [Thermoanaerobaculia bacterium]|jgi:SAM-dependent methyltransferase
MQINVGCGQTPTTGWRNFDNSFSLRLARWPRIFALAVRLRLLDPNQRSFVAFARSADIEWADALHLPLGPETVDALYTSHMLEHLDRSEAREFIAEAIRVLRPGGMIRVAVPDLNRLLASYASTGDADAFVAATLLAIDKPRAFWQRVRLLIFGPRNHLWAYDSRSLCKLLTEHGFVEATTRPPGTTGIPQPGSLDLHEREGESLYVEAAKPTLR